MPSHHNRRSRPAAVRFGCGRNRSDPSLPSLWLEIFEAARVDDTPSDSRGKAGTCERPKLLRPARRVEGLLAPKGTQSSATRVGNGGSEIGVGLILRYAGQGVIDLLGSETLLIELRADPA